MKISINTETEELEELRHAVAIIEDAIKRRENPEDYEEDLEEENLEDDENPSLENFEQEESKPLEDQERPPLEKSTPEIDMSSLTMSDHGEKNENRTMSNLTPPQEPTEKSNKSIVKDIIITIRNEKPGQPIQMAEIVNKARNNSIQEQETRNLVSELQKEGAI